MSDQKVINYLKGLVIDGVHQAQSGHPGGAMSSMDFAYLLFTEFLNFDAQDPQWMGRDRFILSAGHESMLQYAFLYASGILTLDDLKAFRQHGSRTPGHPENTMTPGVECTTGPLGQGCAMSVGFALAATHLKASLHPELFAHKVWTLLGDGCMQEDVTLGAASLAGHLQLDNLIWYYDKNEQQISGHIRRATSDDERVIFAGFGWNVIEVDGHDHDELRAAMEFARNHTGSPTLIVGKSVMAKGASSLEGSHKTHGSPLPDTERDATKRSFGIPDSTPFYWPAEADAHFKRNFPKLRSTANEWRKKLASALKDPAFRKQYDAYFQPLDTSTLPALQWSGALATRSSFGKIIEAWTPLLPNLIGGSADLEPSNSLEGYAKMVRDFTAEDRKGRNIAFGVREFPMSAISNGIALHGGLIPFDATFLSFADYSRPALRLGAIQKLRVIHEFTHDSFYLGEDGPTHQPVEHLMSLRAIPELYVMRPADSNETEAMMRVALGLHAPTCICLSRQNLPLFANPKDDVIAGATRGAWIAKNHAQADVVIYATGSEVSLALAVATEIEKTKNQGVRVISIPCWELFFAQDAAYRETIMNRSCKKRIAIEAGVTLGWERFVGMDGLIIGLDHFGSSGKPTDLAAAFGFTPQAILTKFLNHRFGG